ncbi:MAG: AmmeMemoRadiSam system protein B [archaeon]
MPGDREPAVAGQFYEADANALSDQVADAFTHRLGPGTMPAPGDGPPDATGIVSPHAGLPYSGPVAAHGYAEMARQGRPEVVVLVGPNHSGIGDPVAVSAADRWRTPLGTVPVDEGVRDRLLDATPSATLDEAAHRGEHSLEVQLPFLQVLYEAPPTIVPVVMSRQDRDTALDLGSALATVVAETDESVVLVASTDLTHYEPQSVATENDATIVDRIEALDATGLLDVVARQSLSMCGYGPTAAVLHASATVGASAGRSLQYATSGDLTGSTDEVVGYCSAVLV